MPTLRVNGYDMAFAERGTARPCFWFTARFATIAIGRARWSRSARVTAQSPSASGIAGRKNGTAKAMISPSSNTQGCRQLHCRAAAGPLHLLGHSRAGISLSGRRRIILISSARSSSLSPEACWRRISRPGLGPSPPAIALGPLYAKAAERIRRGEIDEGLQPTIDMIAGPGGWDRTPESGRQMLRDNAATLLGQIKEQRAPFARADAEAIRAPTLLIAGERSPASFHHILDGLGSALRELVAGRYPQRVARLQCRQPEGVRTRGSGVS